MTAPEIEGSSPLLDCGCGTGWLLDALAEAGVTPARLHGIDVNPERVAAARTRVPEAALVAADARSLPYPDSTFGAVFQIVALSSMGDRAATRLALEESWRVLTGGGALAVYESRLPNPLNTETRTLRRTDLAGCVPAAVTSRSLTLLPPLGRRLGRWTGVAHPALSHVALLRSHRLLVLRKLP